MLTNMVFVVGFACRYLVLIADACFSSCCHFDRVVVLDDSGVVNGSDVGAVLQSFV